MIARIFGRLTIACLVSGTAIAAQQPTFKSGIDLVNFAITVTDRKGNLVAASKTRLRVTGKTESP